MCLIAYVPAGKALSREVFDNAHRVNSDGIGIMSAKGVEKFFGSKALKRARQYTEILVKEKLAHAVHWRYATHGARQESLCHPFKLPNVNAYLMHNGVIGSTAQDATDDASDTLLFVNKLIDAPLAHEPLDYWNKVCSDIGTSNKAVVMYEGGHFILLHKEHGTEIDGIWYSNSYSLPVSMRPNSGYFMPSRLRPKSQWDGYGGHQYNPHSPYYGEGRSGFDQHGSYYQPGSVGPYGRIVYWSDQQKAYGFWAGSRFVKLKVQEEEQPPIELTPDLKPTVVQDNEKCTRCNKFKHRASFQMECFCTLEQLREWHASQSGGPTLGGERIVPPNPNQCVHGADSWDNCRECVNEVEQTTNDEVQEWLAKRRMESEGGGIVRSLGSDKILYLPQQKASDK